MPYESSQPDIQEMINRKLEANSERVLYAEIGEPSDNWSPEKAWDRKLMSSIDIVKPGEIVGEYIESKREKPYSPSLPERLKEKIKSWKRRFRDFKNLRNFQKDRSEKESDIAKIIREQRRKHKTPNKYPFESKSSEDDYREIMDQQFTPGVRTIEKTLFDNDNEYYVEEGTLRIDYPDGCVDTFPLDRCNRLYEEELTIGNLPHAKKIMRKVENMSFENEVKKLLEHIKEVELFGLINKPILEGDRFTNFFVKDGEAYIQKGDKKIDIGSVQKIELIGKKKNMDVLQVDIDSPWCGKVRETVFCPQGIEISVDFEKKVLSVEDKNEKYII